MHFQPSTQAIDVNSDDPSPPAILKQKREAALPGTTLPHDDLICGGMRAEKKACTHGGLTHEADDAERRQATMLRLDLEAEALGTKSPHCFPAKDRYCRYCRRCWRARCLLLS